MRHQTDGSNRRLAALTRRPLRINDFRRLAGECTQICPMRVAWHTKLTHFSPADMATAHRKCRWAVRAPSTLDYSFGADPQINRLRLGLLPSSRR
jgi:hypothetical protein